MRNEFYQVYSKWIWNVTQCCWIKLLKICCIVELIFEMEILKFQKILFPLKHSLWSRVRCSTILLIKYNPDLGIKNWKRKKNYSFYFYIFITSHILCHFTSLIGHFILASVKRSKTIDLVGFQFQHPNEASKLKLYSYFIKRTEDYRSMEYIPSIYKNYVSNNIKYFNERYIIILINISEKRISFVIFLFPKELDIFLFFFFFFWWLTVALNQ